MLITLQQLKTALQAVKNYIISVIPSKTSDLTNDSGFINTETDPTVPSWAKAATKPTYTASEVGALPSTTVIPSKVSDLTNDSGFVGSASVTSIWTGTQAQYEALTPDANTLYFI